MNDHPTPALSLLLSPERSPLAPPSPTESWYTPWSSPPLLSNQLPPQNEPPSKSTPAPVADTGTEQLDTMVELLKENRIAQLASIDQQREIMRNIRILNERLEKIEARGRQSFHSSPDPPATPRIWPAGLESEEPSISWSNNSSVHSPYIPPMFGGLGGAPLSIIPESPRAVPRPMHPYASVPFPPPPVHDTGTPFIPPLPSPEGSPEPRHSGALPSWLTNAHGSSSNSRGIPPPAVPVAQSPPRIPYLNPYMGTPYAPAMSFPGSPRASFIPGSYPIATPTFPFVSPPPGTSSLRTDGTGSGVPAPFTPLHSGAPPLAASGTTFKGFQQPFYTLSSLATPLFTPPSARPGSPSLFVERRDLDSGTGASLPLGFVPTAFVPTPPVNAVAIANMGTPYVAPPGSLGLNFTPVSNGMAMASTTVSPWVLDPLNPGVAAVQTQAQAMAAQVQVQLRAAQEAATAELQAKGATQTQAAAATPLPLSRPQSTYWRESRAGRESTIKIGCFAIGTHYGPVLTPFLAALVKPEMQVNPILKARSMDDSGALLEWDMLWPSSNHLRLDGSSEQCSWARCRDEPATFPRLTSLCVVSRAFPSRIYIKAGDASVGVTCGDMIDGLDDYFHTVAGDIFDNATNQEKNDVMNSYNLNRSLSLSSPREHLGKDVCLVDWLGKDTVFGGISWNGMRATKERYGLPIVFELRCSTRQQPADSKNG